MISHTAANSVKVVAEGLAGDHGETDERPMPLPSATRSKVLVLLTHTDRAGSLSSLAIIEAADAVQTNGFGSALCSAR